MSVKRAVYVHFFFLQPCYFILPSSGQSETSYWSLCCIAKAKWNWDCCQLKWYPSSSSAWTSLPPLCHHSDHHPLPLSFLVGLHAYFSWYIWPIEIWDASFYCVIGRTCGMHNWNCSNSMTKSLLWTVVLACQSQRWFFLANRMKNGDNDRVDCPLPSACFLAAYICILLSLFLVQVGLQGQEEKCRVQHITT